MSLKTCKLRNGIDELKFWVYQPDIRDFPPGFKETTTSRGVVAIVPRADGVHWTMQPFDVALQVNAGGWVALPGPAFAALFDEAKQTEEPDDV